MLDEHRDMLISHSGDTDPTLHIGVRLGDDRDTPISEDGISTGPFSTNSILNTSISADQATDNTQVSSAVSQRSTSGTLQHIPVFS